MIPIWTLALIVPLASLAGIAGFLWLVAFALDKAGADWEEIADDD